VNEEQPVQRDDPPAPVAPEVYAPDLVPALPPDQPEPAQDAPPALPEAPAQEQQSAPVQPATVEIRFDALPGVNPHWEGDEPGGTLPDGSPARWWWNGAEYAVSAADAERLLAKPGFSRAATTAPIRVPQP
jgi:hypothetical protein